MYILLAPGEQQVIDFAGSRLTLQATQEGKITISAQDPIPEALKKYKLNKRSADSPHALSLPRKEMGLLLETLLGDEPDLKVTFDEFCMSDEAIQLLGKSYIKSKDSLEDYAAESEEPGFEKIQILRKLYRDRHTSEETSPQATESEVDSNYVKKLFAEDNKTILEELLKGAEEVVRAQYARYCHPSTGEKTPEKTPSAQFINYLSFHLLELFKNCSTTDTEESLDFLDKLMSLLNDCLQSTPKTQAVIETIDALYTPISTIVANVTIPHTCQRHKEAHKYVQKRMGMGNAKLTEFYQEEGKPFSWLETDLEFTARLMTTTPVQIAKILHLTEEQLQQQIKDKTEAVLQKEMQKEMQKQIQEVMQQVLQEVMEDELKDELKDELQLKFQEKLKEGKIIQEAMQEAMQEVMQVDMQESIKDKLTKRMEEKIADNLKAKAKAQIQGQMLLDMMYHEEPSPQPTPTEHAFLAKIAVANYDVEENKQSEALRVAYRRFKPPEAGTRLDTIIQLLKAEPVKVYSAPLSSKDSELLTGERAIQFILKAIGLDEELSKSLANTEKHKDKLPLCVVFHRAGLSSDQIRRLLDPSPEQDNPIQQLLEVSRVHAQFSRSQPASELCTKHIQVLLSPKASKTAPQDGTTMEFNPLFAGQSSMTIIKDAAIEAINSMIKRQDNKRTFLRWGREGRVESRKKILDSIKEQFSCEEPFTLEIPKKVTIEEGDTFTEELLQALNALLLVKGEEKIQIPGDERFRCLQSQLKDLKEAREQFREELGLAPPRKGLECAVEGYTVNNKEGMDPPPSTVTGALALSKDSGLGNSAESPPPRVEDTRSRSASIRPSGVGGDSTEA